MPPYVLIVLVVAMLGLMFWQSRKAKQQQSELQDFRESLEPGTEVITIGGIIGKVVSVDAQYEEIVLDSEGSLLRFTFRAINKAYVRPAFVGDDEVDEEGNPLPDAEGQTTQDDAEPAQITDGEDDGADVRNPVAVDDARTDSGKN